MTTLLAGGGYAYLIATPIYRSTVSVILETNQDQIVDLHSVASGLTGDWQEISSEIEVLRSRGLIGKVVDQLALVRDPEFNKALRQPDAMQKTRRWVSTALERGSPPIPDYQVSQTRRVHDGTVSALKSSLSVRNVRDSLVLNLTVSSKSPVKAALIADTWANAYIANQIELKFHAMDQATTWLANRVSELQSSLEKAEAAAADFSARTDLISVDALRALERQSKDLRDRIATARARRAELASTLVSLERAETPSKWAELAIGPQPMRLDPRAETDHATAATPDLQVDATMRHLRQNLTRADRQITALNTSVADLDAQIEVQSSDLITLQQLNREAHAIRTLYEYFLTRLNETSAQQGIQKADSRILSQAVIPSTPSTPRTSSVMALSCVLGLLLGAAFVLLRELRNDTFRTPGQLEMATGYTVIGQIPTAPAIRRANLIHYLAEKPASETAEAVRNLRTSLMFGNADNPPKVIVSTSALPGEGKTTNAVALAHNLLGLGKKVLLIEGDIRRCALRDYINDMPHSGLVSVLIGTATPDQAIFRSENLGFDVLGGEGSNLNAADLFASSRFAELIAELRDHYDAVIIDTPPVLLVPDARLIAENADAVIFNVHWDKTSKSQVLEALRLLHNSGQRLTGMVLSKIDPRGMKRYGHGGKYGAYANYGSGYYAN